MNTLCCDAFALTTPMEIPNVSKVPQSFVYTVLMADKFLNLSDVEDM